MTHHAWQQREHLLSLATAGKQQRAHQARQQQRQCISTVVLTLRRKGRMLVLRDQCPLPPPRAPPPALLPSSFAVATANQPLSATIHTHTVPQKQQATTTTSSTCPPSATMSAADEKDMGFLSSSESLSLQPCSALARVSLAQTSNAPSRAAAPAYVVAPPSESTWMPPMLTLLALAVPMPPPPGAASAGTSSATGLMYRDELPIV